MLQNLNLYQNNTTEMGVGGQPDEILCLIDYIDGKYGQNRMADGNYEGLVNGVPVAPGVAEGYAVVIQTPEDLHRINADSILICPRMSPVYSVAFQTVRGIISEQGGILSTAATIARGKGLPAVTGIQQARQIISDGDLIRIDGTRGVVQIKAKALN